MIQFLKIYFRKTKSVVCYRNSGFGDNLFQAACGWLYAKNCNRSLLINWTNSRYLSNKKLNAFFYFFTIPNSILGVEIIKTNKINLLLRLKSTHFLNVLFSILNVFYLKLISNKTENIFYKKKSRLLQNISIKEHNLIDKNINVSNKIVYFRACISNLTNEVKPFFDSIKPSEEILNEIENFTNKYFKNKKVIGVHVRYYNKNLVKSDHTKYWIDEDLGLKTIYEKIQKAINKVNNNDYVIFLATDSSLPNEYIKTNFSNVVSFPKTFGINSAKELHEELPQETAKATIAEMFLLAKSDILVRFPPGSWFSHYASLYVEDIIT